MTTGYEDTDSYDNQTGDEVIKVYQAGDSFGEECLDDDDYTLPFNLVSRTRSIALTLRRKDFAELLLQHLQQKKAIWLKTLLKIPMMAELPFKIV